MKRKLGKISFLFLVQQFQIAPKLIESKKEKKQKAKNFTLCALMVNYETRKIIVQNQNREMRIKNITKYVE